MYQSIQLPKTTSSPGTSISRSPRRRPRILGLCAAAPALVFLLSAAATAFAGSATWRLDPGETLCPSCWRDGSEENWTPATVPDGPSDTASFDLSNVTSIAVDDGFDIEVNGIVFNPGASAFTIAVATHSSFDGSLTISGVGITNNSGIKQNIMVSDSFAEEFSALNFTNSAAAGDLTVLTAVSSNQGAWGTISFEDDSIADNASVRVFAEGRLDISGHNVPGVTVGSIEGDGLVFIGANNLAVGSSDLGTAFSGIIQDGGTGGSTGGSLTKIGTGKLVLTNANTYSGGTTINGGALFVHNRMGSATGSGAVQVDAGRLAGRGIIAGPVTVGRGSGALADLSPGEEVKPGTLKCLSTLTFNNKGAYHFQLDSDRAIADQVIANGVTIRSRAHFFVTDFGSGILSSAELYDSASGTWTVTGSLLNTRIYHTATLLTDGRVLVAGGFDGNFAKSAELYDPALGTWTATGSLIDTTRASHTATLLPNGKVLVAGGSDIFGVTASAELYDPATETWSATGNMNTALFARTATLLPNGKVLIAGGYTGTSTSASAELYDPATGTWKRTGSLATLRYGHTATLLPNGEVLVAGGFESPSAELYDPATGTWSATGSPAAKRAFATATLLPSGKPLVAGGFYQEGNGSVELASAELYDSTDETWSATGELAAAREGHTATLLTDGRVLVAGGFGAGLPIGTVFTAISNTSATPISGTFINLADGSTITVRDHSYKVSYSGGDGNDLTLTVVP